MDEGEIQGPDPIGRVRWLWFLLILGAYPVAVGVIGTLSGSPGDESQPALPGEIPQLLGVLALELMLFGAVFLLGWGFCRASARDLYFRWNGGIRPVIRGAVYSIGLRIAIAIVTVLIIGILSAGRSPEQAEESADWMRPRVEKIVDPDVLVSQPAYLVINMTVMSFVVAGFREELWRAGMFAAMVHLLPSLGRNRTGQLVMAMIAAIVFGLGHLPQGWGGVLLTFVLGVGLGWILLRQNSIWEAVFAHGFFDATSLFLLYLYVKSQGSLPGT